MLCALFILPFVRCSDANAGARLFGDSPSWMSFERQRENKPNRNKIATNSCPNVPMHSLGPARIKSEWINMLNRGMAGAKLRRKPPRRMFILCNAKGMRTRPSSLVGFEVYCGRQIQIFFSLFLFVHCPNHEETRKKKKNTRFLSNRFWGFGLEWKITKFLFRLMGFREEWKVFGKSNYKVVRQVQCEFVCGAYQSLIKLDSAWFGILARISRLRAPNAARANIKFRT